MFAGHDGAANATKNDMTIRDNFIIQDLRILEEIFLKNVYRLPDRMDGQRVIDVGAHIGAFSVACVIRGAGQVIAAEPEWENYKLLVENTSGYPVVIRHQRAVWSEGDKGFVMELDGNNPAGHSMARPGPPKGLVETVHTVTLDSLIEPQPVDFLKIDAESAEFPILLTSNNLGMVKRMAVEYHTEPLRPEAGCKASVNALIAHLRRAGFHTIEFSNEFKHDIYERGIIHASSQ